MPKANSVNKAILVGNVGQDPEVKYTASGVPVAKLSVATNERFKDKEGNWQDRTEWHNVVAWQRLAEIVGEYLKKGNKVYIEGAIRTNSWDDRESGQKKYRTEIIANDLVLLGGRGEGGSSEEGGGGYSRAHSAQAAGGKSGGSGGGSGNDQRQAEPDYAQSTQITDEDIPF